MTLAMLGGTLVAPLTRAQRHGTLRAIQYTPCRGLMVGTAVVGVEVIRLVQQAIRSAAGVLAHDVQQPVCHWWVEQAGLRGTPARRLRARNDHPAAPAQTGLPHACACEHGAAVSAQPKIG
jgi:hypothetical protein